MDVPYPGQRQVRHCPFHRPPIVGEEHVRGESLQHLADEAQVGQGRTPPAPGLGKADVKIGREASSAVEASIQGNDRMAHRRAVVVGQARKAHLGPAKLEDGEYAGDQRPAARRQRKVHVA